MKNKQNDAVFMILLSIVFTSCTANDKPFDSVSETQTSGAVTATISTAGNLDSTTETEKSISDTEVQTVSVTETEAGPVFMENAEKLDLECGKTTSEERDLDTILQEDYKSPMVEWSSDKRYAAMVETTENYSIKSGFIEVFDSVTNTVTSMPYLEIQNCIHAEVSDTVNLYTCDLLTCEWITDDILKVNFDMKTGVSFYNQSNFGWYTYNFTEGKVTALSYEMDIPEPVENTMTDEEIKAVIDENLDILMTGEDCYFEKDYIDAHPDAFEKIITFGDAALPYLEEMIENIPYDNLLEQDRWYLIKAAIYFIKPDIYDKEFLSPDKKYAIKATVHSIKGTYNDAFSGIEYHFCIIEKETGNILVTASNMTFDISNPFLSYITWSDDSQYVAIQQGYRHYFSDVYLFDICELTFQYLPDFVEINKIINQEIVYTNDNGSKLNYLHCYFDEFLENQRVKIKISLSSNAGEYMDIGWYIYDINNKTVDIYIECDNLTVEKNSLPI